MDCKNFGIGLIILSATLFLGITVSEIFELNETQIPEIEVVEERIDSLNNLSLDAESLKECEPANKDLRYRTLLFTEKERIYKEIDKRDLPELLPVPETREKAGRNSGNSKKDETEKIKKAASKLPVGLSKENISVNKDLVYKEICREKENGRKNGAKNNN